MRTAQRSEVGSMIQLRIAAQSQTTGTPTARWCGGSTRSTHQAKPRRRSACKQMRAERWRDSAGEGYSDEIMGWSGTAALGSCSVYV